MFKHATTEAKMKLATTKRFNEEDRLASEVRNGFAYRLVGDGIMIVPVTHVSPDGKIGVMIEWDAKHYQSDARVSYRVTNLETGEWLVYDGAIRPKASARRFELRNALRIARRYGCRRVRRSKAG